MRAAKTKGGEGETPKNQGKRGSFAFARPSLFLVLGCGVGVSVLFGLATVARRSWGQANGTGGTEALGDMEGEEGQRRQQQIRVVRCPKCEKFLPELPNYSVYVCGGCGATLQGPPPFSSFPSLSLSLSLIFALHLTYHFSFAIELAFRFVSHTQW